MTKRYDTARASFEYLESLAPLEDQVELDSEREALMRCPTKTKAAGIYESAIRLWLDAHGPQKDYRAGKIAKKYAI